MLASATAAFLCWVRLLLLPRKVPLLLRWLLLRLLGVFLGGLEAGILHSCLPLLAMAPLCLARHPWPLMSPVQSPPPAAGPPPVQIVSATQRTTESNEVLHHLKLKLQQGNMPEQTFEVGPREPGQVEQEAGGRTRGQAGGQAGGRAGTGLGLEQAGTGQGRARQGKQA